MESERNNISVQDLYLNLNEHLREIEESVLKIEQVFFASTPIFEELETLLDRVIKLLTEEEMYAMVKKLNRFKKLILRMQGDKGYNPEYFQNIFAELRTISQEGPQDVLSGNTFQHTLYKFESAARRFLTPAHQETDEHISAGYKKFLMVRDAGVHFLLPFSKKMWQKKIIQKAYKDQLKISIKNNEIADKFIFNNLMKTPRETILPERYAVLLTNEQNKMKGILTDYVEGTIYLNPHLFIEKTERMSTASKSNPYIFLKGKRFFIRHLV